MSRATDAEIRKVEERIAYRRMLLSQTIDDCGASFRRRASSPGALLAALAGGFVTGVAALRTLRRAPDQRRRERRAPNGSSAAPAAKSGVLGLLAAWGLALARARLLSAASPHGMLADLFASRLRRH
jgi:hypothetical protein